MNTLTQRDLAEIEGGVIPPLVIWVGSAVAGGIIGGVLDGWPDFKLGIREGFNSTAN